MVDMHLEVDVVPVSDVDRSKQFYGRLGWKARRRRRPRKRRSHRPVHAPGLGVLSHLRQGNNRSSAGFGRWGNKASPLPRWIPPQLCQLVETAPSGPQWLHEIKLDGFRMFARIERGLVQLLTRTGLRRDCRTRTFVAARRPSDFER
jgi:ATP-dependent DNA ligase